MFKKVLLLAAALVTSSFATWDYFGLLQNNQGSIKAGLYYDKDDDWSQMGLKVGARFNVSPKFELSLQSFGYQFWSETDCDACEEGGNGIRDLMIGGRFAVSIFYKYNITIRHERDQNRQNWRSAKVRQSRFIVTIRPNLGFRIVPRAVQKCGKIATFHVHGGKDSIFISR